MIFADGKKLFGGYKITPRFCKPSRKTSQNMKGPNICMFNHECKQRNGIVVGACMDGFLFGACCQLPEGIVGELMEEDDRVTLTPDSNKLQTFSYYTKAPYDYSSTSGLYSSQNKYSTSSQYSTPGKYSTPGQYSTSGQFSPSGQYTTSGQYSTSGHSSNSGKPNKYSTPSHYTNSDFTQGLSQITNSLLHSPVLPTAQDNVVVQLDGDQNFLTTGVTHPSAPDTIIVHNGASSINSDDFKPVAEDRKTTFGIEETTSPYRPDAPIIQISISNGISNKPYKKPGFRPKPSRPSDNDKYVLVPTITHSVNTNKTQEFDSIVNIIQMLNESTTSSSSTFGSTKRPPSTSYIFSVTPPQKRPGYSTTPSKKPPSTSYVFSTTPIPSRPGYKPSTSTKRKPSTQTARPTTIKNKISSPNKIASQATTNYIYPSSTSQYTYSTTPRPKPNKSTYASSPSAFNTTKKPPSTSYVYSSTITRRPTTPSNKPSSQTYSSTPSYSSTPQSNVYSSTSQSNLYSSKPSSPPPTVIVLSPVNSGFSTPKPQVNSVTKPPQRKPVTQLTINNYITQNYFSTESPSPTVLITPKPSSSTGNPLKPITDFETTGLEQETSSNDLINFPPVRNPNLNMSSPILDEDDITTPAFVEDAVLDKKVASFVNKIIEGLQEPFEGLTDIVYNRNKTALENLTTKKPVKKTQTTKKPTSVNKPSTNKVTTRKPPTRRPVTNVSTKRTTVTTKRTKPTKATTVSYIEEDESTESGGSLDFRNRKFLNTVPNALFCFEITTKKHV